MAVRETLGALILTCAFCPALAQQTQQAAHAPGSPAPQTLAASEQPANVLAAQIRLQGFACDKPLGAKQDVKRSRPDHAVWVLRCSNATYRVSRFPDMAATVIPVR